MGIPKKLVAGAVVAAGKAAPYVGEAVSKKLKENAEKKEQERIYANQKHNGIIKILAIVLSLVSIVISILAINQNKIIAGILGILAIIVYIITFLYCFEIIHEKRHNVYKIIFILGDMLLVTGVTLLFI